jgi:hypothetical protein
MQYRVIQYVIAPAVVYDDGETLTPIPMQQVVIPAGEIDTFGERFRVELEARAAEEDQAGGDDPAKTPA